MPISKRTHLILPILGYAALASIHWWHSWPALSTGRVFPDLGDSRSADPLLEAFQTLTLLYLFACYLLCLINWKLLQFTTNEVKLMILVQGAIAWSALPANSTDILGYIGLGRIAAIHGANPYLHTYSEFTDHYSAYMEWDITMPYGPVLLPLIVAAGQLSQYSLLLSIYFLKLGWLLTHGANCWLLHRILGETRTPPPYGLFLFGLNPLLLLELIANGHNDGLLILFGLLAIRALQRQRHGSAVWLALLSALVKLPGIFFWGATLIYLARARQWRGLIGGLTGSTALLLALVTTLLPGIESLSSLSNPGAYTKNSLHTLLLGLAEGLSSWLGAAIDYDILYSLDRYIFTLLFLGFCLWRWRRVLDLSSMVGELALLFLTLLIAYTTWFFPWYVTWLLPLAAITESARLQRIIVIYSWTALALYAFPNFIVEHAPLHWLWAALRIAIVHLIPGGLLVYTFSKSPFWLEKPLRRPTAVSE